MTAPTTRTTMRGLLHLGQSVWLDNREILDMLTAEDVRQAADQEDLGVGLTADDAGAAMAHAKTRSKAPLRGGTMRIRRQLSVWLVGPG